MLKLRTLQEDFRERGYREAYDTNWRMELMEYANKHVINGRSHINYSVFPCPNTLQSQDGRSITQFF